MFPRKLIGIVGGVGPKAGLDLFEKIISNTNATDDQDHLPVILISVPAFIADRTSFLLSNEILNPGKVLSSITDQLVDNGARLIAIPCNTAHSPKIFDEMRDHVERHANVRLLHMIDETASYIQNRYPKGSKISVLSTLGTRQTHVYEPFLQQHGLNVVELTLEQANTVHAVIYNKEYGIKSHSSPVTELAKEKLCDVISELAAQGVDAVILGCTELPLAFPNIYECKGIRLIDPTIVLARALIHAHSPDKLIPMSS